MKKSLLAVAAMTAFAGAAQAQSSVTVYGILDVGFIGSNYSAIGTQNVLAQPGTLGADAVPSAGGIVQRQNMATIGQSAESTSRIGFKGTEDLGGGTQALFTVEAGLSPNGQSATSQFSFNRQTFAGLHKNGLGAVTIGTQYTPLFDVQSQTDAAGNNNLVGNAIYSTNPQSSTGSYNAGAAPWTGAYGAIATSAAATATNAVGFTVASGNFGTRVSNALKVTSDRMSGLQATLMYAQASSSATVLAGSNYGSTGDTGGVNANTMFGAGLDYEWKKLKVVGAYQQYKSFNPSSGATGNAAGIISSTSAVTAGSPGSPTGDFGQNMIDQQSYVSATYDFGILKAYAQWINRLATSTIDSSYTAKRTAEQIGVRAPITSTISAFASAGMGSSTLFGQSVPQQNFRTFQIGSDYALSKRTNLYAIYGQYSQSSSGATPNSVIGNSASMTALSASTVGTNGNNYAVGIRHTF